MECSYTLPITVAILAQGTHWAVAVTQAYFFPGHTVLVRLRTYLAEFFARLLSNVCQDARLETFMLSHHLPRSPVGAREGGAARRGGVRGVAQPICV